MELTQRKVDEIALTILKKHMDAWLNSYNKKDDTIS